MAYPLPLMHGTEAIRGTSSDFYAVRHVADAEYRRDDCAAGGGRTQAGTAGCILLRTVPERGKVRNAEGPNFSAGRRNLRTGGRSRTMPRGRGRRATR